MLHEQIRFHRGLLLALAVFGAGCASSGDAPEVVPGRAPLVDPASGRIEEIPDTELPVPVQLAPELTGERQQAAERLSAVVARLGTRDDARSGPFPFDGLSDAELRQWLADRYVLTGDSAEAAHRRTLGAAAHEVELIGRERPALGPTAVQDAAVLELHRSALGSLEVTWNATGGTPREIVGPLFLERGVDTAVVAADFIRSGWPLHRQRLHQRSDLAAALSDAALHRRLLRPRPVLRCGSVLQPHAQADADDRQLPNHLREV